MKIVCASDSFKGSLSSSRICELVEAAAADVVPGAECVPLLMADGGEGTLDAIGHVWRNRQGDKRADPSSERGNVPDSEPGSNPNSEQPLQHIPLYVFNGLKQRMRCNLAVCGGEAFVEAATTCGILLMREREFDLLTATSNGVGACIAHALLHGCEKVTIGLGGTCTNDGGMGCLRALGVRFFDRAGRELGGCAADLEKVARIDESGLFPQVRDATFTILCDVTNPLLGPHGATHTFARQKGADDLAIARLEAGMRTFADAIAQTHPDADFTTPGFGAAGGLGMALSVFLGARIEPGAEAMLRLVNFDTVIEGADLVITGEGQLDEQSLSGKVVGAVAAHAQRKGVPVAVICGTNRLDERQLQELGLAHVVEAAAGQPPEQAMLHAEENYARAARDLLSRL